ncbi:MAG: GNAT family N-acetyltransferase [Ruminococcus sp.]|nr:GNAT family N-acetyltransferase [Ruminococcus sp.]
MDLTVRKATEKDIPKILDLLVQVDMVHHNGRPDIFKGPATKYNEEELKAVICNEETPVFVCVDENDIPLGHAFCIHKQVVGDSVLTDIRTLYIDDICVDSDARGKHVGKTLFDYVVAYAKSTGFYNVTLNVWTSNQSAMKFYEAMGLTPQRIVMEMLL